VRGRLCRRRRCRRADQHQRRLGDGDAHSWQGSTLVCPTVACPVPTINALMHFDFVQAHKIFSFSEDSS
jgi:hypothetical protein